MTPDGRRDTALEPKGQEQARGRKKHTCGYVHLNVIGPVAEQR